MFFFLIIRTPPGSTLTDPLFPYTTLFRSDAPLSSTKANNMTTPGKELLFLALGGSGEIGMNANLYGCDGKWIMADLGVTFGSHDYPGIDIVMPELEFIEDRKKDFDRKSTRLNSHH